MAEEKISEKKKAVPQINETYRPIEEWAKDKSSDPVLLEGMKVHMGWRTGKCVTEKEFDSAMKSFAGSPADGRKR